MDTKHEILKETIAYQPGTKFLMHNNISDTCYTNHWHNAVEIIMPVKNAYNVEVNYKKYTLNENDILIIPSGEMHCVNTTNAEGQRIILQFNIEMLSAVHGFISASYVYASARLIRSTAVPKLHEPVYRLLTEILDEHLNQNQYSAVAITQKIIGITLHLARSKPGDNEMQYEDISKQKLYIERLNECFEYIEQNYNKKLSLEEVAQSIGYSKYHFSRWFQENASVSFLDYLTKVRMNKAEVLLISSEKSMTDIAMESGFQSTNTFNRIFKKYNGCTPSEYRDTHLLRKRAAALYSTHEERKETVIMMKPPAPHGVPGFSAHDAVYRKAGDGLYHNPIIWADIPDPDVIRVGDVYYMTSTTMYFTPGIPVMKSYDLIHWEIVNYVYDILDSEDTNALRNGSHAYGKGSWASSLRYHSGIYYVAACALNTGKTYIFQTEDIENGPWSRYELDYIYHDPGLLFDDDGRVYLVYGGGTIRIIELTEDAKAVLPGGLDKIIIENADAGGPGGLPAEGSHIYKIGGRYYLFLIAWPPGGSGRRIQLCYRADSVEGPYTGRVVLDDNMGYNNNGVAQGGIFDTPDGSTYAMLFQDHGAVGRIPVLIPVTWEDGFPVFGTGGCVPLRLKPYGEKEPGQGAKAGIIASDEFYAHAPCKDYTAANSTGYRCAGTREPAQLPGKADNGGTELLINRNFRDGTDHWDVMEVADIETVKDEDTNTGSALFVSGRTTTASGPRQMITGKVRPGSILQARAVVKYTSGPEEKTFHICIRNGKTWEGIRVIGTGRLKRGQWGSVYGAYRIKKDADMSESSIFIETPWADKPKKETDLMDFRVSCVSVKEMPDIRNTALRDGENDPPEEAPALCWQWSHNPDNTLWSLTERPGFLRLKSAYLCDDILHARNTLTQRTFGPVCSGTAALEVGGMKDGDTAGLAVLQEIYGYIAVKCAAGEKYIVVVNTSSEAGHKEEVHPHMLAGCHAFIPLPAERVYLRADIDCRNSDTARFYYSLDEISWHAIGEPLNMQYKLSHFTGYRFALFYYAALLPGGYADFDYFRFGDKLAEDNSSMQVLDASFICDKQALGTKGNKVKVSVCMDELKPDDCKGIYMSFAVPDLFDILRVDFHNENICGDAGYSIIGSRLMLQVTGESVSFTHKLSGRFADIEFVINSDRAEDVTVYLRPDYICTDGGNVSYRTHFTCAEIQIYAPGTFTRGWYEHTDNRFENDESRQQ